MLEDDIINYLEKIGKPTTVRSIVDSLNIAHSTVNSAIKRLVEKKLVIWEPYKTVELVAAGKTKAHHYKLHEHLIGLFLMDTLQISENLAHKEGKKIANIISCELIEKICAKYNHPNQCICGEDLGNVINHEH